MERDSSNGADSAAPQRAAVRPMPRPTRLHPIVAEAKKLYAKAKVGNGGWYSSPDRSVLRLSVTRASLSRALHLVDALFRAAEARGHLVKRATREIGCVHIVVEDDCFEVSIRERTEKVPHVLTKQERARVEDYTRRYGHPPSLFGPPEYDHRPTGELAVVLEDARARATESAGDGPRRASAGSWRTGSALSSRTSRGSLRSATGSAWRMNAVGANGRRRRSGGRKRRGVARRNDRGRPRSNNRSAPGAWPAIFAHS
jgi:hypothetical protein